MPRDILSRSGSRPQQQSQPALLPDKKGRQRLLEGGATLGKFDFHAHAAHAKAVGEYYPPWEPPVSRFRAIRKWYFPPSEPPQHIVAAHIFDFTINLLIVILGELLMQYHQIIYREVFLCLRRQKSEVFWNFWEKI